MKKSVRIAAIALLVVLALCLVVLPALAEGNEVTTINWTDVLSYLLYGVLTIVASIVTKYIIPYLKTITAAKTASIENTRLQNGVTEAVDAVLTAVTVTNQTYVDALKNKNMFDADAQRVAFQKSWDMAQGLLTDAAKNALCALYGNVNDWLTARIEQTTNELKNGFPPIKIAETVVSVE